MEEVAEKTLQRGGFVQIAMLKVSGCQFAKSAESFPH